MSENILLGKSRKTGKWELLADPGDGYDAHLRAYQKIAKDLPVNETYSKILLGRVQNTSSPLTLITKEEKEMRDLELAETRDRASNAGKDADERQTKLNAIEADRRAETHAAVIDDKNAMINKLRKATGQEVFTKTQTEQAAEDLRERLSKVEVKKPLTDEEKKKLAADEALKSKEQLLAEKNELTAATQKQVEEINKTKPNK